MSLLKELKDLLQAEPWTDELPRESWEVVESGDWTDCHKAESREDIVKHTPSGKFFSVDLYRTGDHWQGYETELTDVTEVEPFEKVITAYRPVKLLDVTVAAVSHAKAVEND